MGAAAAAPAKKEKKAKSSGGGGGYTMDEVAKHTTKGDCWVVVAGEVLDVTKFLPDHPGGELAILTFAGKDASEEFNMIHPPDVIPKYAPDAVIGAVGTGAPVAAAAPAAGGGGGGKMHEKGSVLANHQAWGHFEGQNWRIDALDHNPGVMIVNVKAYIGAAW